jgi:hypothetical protein
MSIIYPSEIGKFSEHNSSFDGGVLRVAYKDGNKNKSFISKKVFEEAMPSIYNCPIVCRYDREADELGAHDVELVKHADGGLSLVNATHPVGVIPEGAKFFWSDVTEEDGTVHEYLYVDALLWKRQEAYQKIKENGITEESMEISIKDGHMDNGIYVIDRFEFTAFCLLGTAKPCYESAALMMSLRQDFKEQLDEMMQEFKDSVFALQEQNNIEGGTETLSENKSTDNSFALSGQIRESLCNQLYAKTVETQYGTEYQYWYVDYDSEKSEVYAEDSQDWKLYGFSYSISGDAAVINFESKKQKKYAIVDFVEGGQIAEPESAASGVYAHMAEKYSADKTEWESKYQTAMSSYTALDSEVSALRKFKEDFTKEKDTRERGDVFALFKDLDGVEEFEALRTSNEQYSVADLSERCFAIRGRNMIAKFSLPETKPPKLPIEKPNTDAEPYGGVFAEYGIQRN